jgi:DNA polymerase III sliding clamp (beta) subunit (PCNA family)
MARGSETKPVAVQSVTLPSGSLKAALKTVVAAVEARNTIPILSNVLIRVTAEHLTVTATDLDIGVGTAVASNATLATTMINVVAKVDVDADALEVQLEVHSNDQAVTPVKIADGASSALYLNVATGNITADDSIAVI